MHTENHPGEAVLDVPRPDTTPAPRVAPQRPARLPQIDVMRLLICACVVATHADLLLSSDCNEAEPGQPGGRSGVAAYALDPDNAAHLWQVTVDKFHAAGLDR